MSILKEKTLCIHVMFINDETQNIIGEVDLHLNPPPPAFTSIPTTLRITQPAWHMEVLSTPTSEENTSSELHLSIKRIATSIQKQLYTVPSIASHLPDTDTAPSFHGFIHTLASNDWRQYEFLPLDTLPCIEFEMQFISRIWEQYRVETSHNTYAFHQAHVRERIGTPRLHLDLAQLHRLLENSSIDPLQIQNQTEYVEDGFAIHTKAGLFYGIATNQIISTLGFAPKNTPLCPKTLELLEKIAKQSNLVFVNWCKCELLFLPSEPNTSCNQ